jgi:MFS family permease
MADVEPVPAVSSPRTPGSGGTFAPFRYPAFRAIWIANLTSNMGSMIQSVGAAWLMTELTTSHRLIALVQASASLPIMLLGVFAGAIADNYDRRLVMLAAQTGMLVASSALAAMTWAKLMTPPLLLGFTLCVGIGTALNAPSWQASVRQQVGLSDLPQAIALNTISFNLARSVGPGLGGLLISLWNVSLAFAVNAVSYLALIVVLLRWRPATWCPSPSRCCRRLRPDCDFARAMRASAGCWRVALRSASASPAIRRWCRRWSAAACTAPASNTGCCSACSASARSAPRCSSARRGGGSGPKRC